MCVTFPVHLCKKANENVYFEIRPLTFTSNIWLIKIENSTLTA